MTITTKNFTIDTIPTPALVIDETIADRNLQNMQNYVNAHGLNLRPHIKTHKSLLMAKKQLALGAKGLTVAKVGELEVMATICDDILLAYPALDPARTHRIAKVAQKITVRVAVDSKEAVDQLASAARDAGVTIGILVDFDAGMRRTGLLTKEQTLGLAQYILATKGVRHDGLFCYPGHISQTNPAEMTLALQAVNDQLLAILDLWKQHNISALIVTGGSTPAAKLAHVITAYTEVRPGTYIYYCRLPAQNKRCSFDDIAATVLATVVSMPEPDRCVLDVGGKGLTYDRWTSEPGPLNFGTLREISGAYISGLSEEHAVVNLANASVKPILGQRVNIYMNHVCPCVNLYDQGWLIKADRSVEPLKIDARGLMS